MNILFAGDFHILEKDLVEIEEIFSELLIIKDKYCINKVIITGDSFDSINPTSKELDCLSKFLKNLNLPIILLAANSHESTTPEESIVNHLGILNDKISVVKEYKDENKLYVGHFIVKESAKNFGGTVNRETLKGFRNVVLGHGHNHEIIKPNIMQLGSIRRIDFGEDGNIKNMVAICPDYDEGHQKWIILPLNSSYPMISLGLGKKEILEESNNTPNDKKIALRGKESGILASFEAISDIAAYLDKISPKTKVRVVCSDYGLWRKFLPLIDKYNSKFFTFKLKKDFLISENLIKTEKQNNSTLKESLKKYLEINKVPEEIANVLLEQLK